MERLETIEQMEPFKGSDVPMVFRCSCQLDRFRDFLRKAEIEDSLGRRQLLRLDALRGDGDHFALEFFIDDARLQIVPERGFVNSLGVAVAILAKVEKRSFDEIDGKFLVVADQAQRSSAWRG